MKYVQAERVEHFELDAREKKQYPVWFKISLPTIIAILLLFLAILLNARSAPSRAAFGGAEGVRTTEKASSDARNVLSQDIVMPEPGWLYILDGNQMKSSSQVILFNPEEERVVRSYKAGYYPDMALSPDGRRLYVTSTIVTPTGEPRSILEVIDTRRWALLKTVENPHPWRGTLLLRHSCMAVSQDGRWLFALRHQQSNEGDIYSIATFDTERGDFLPESALIPGCVSAILQPLSETRELVVSCTGTSDVRFLKIGKSGRATGYDKVPLKYMSGAKNGQRIGPTLVSDKRVLTVVMGDGRYFKIDGITKAIEQTEGIDSIARKEKLSSQSVLGKEGDWFADRWMPFQSSLVSPDKKRIYAGISRLDDLRNGNQFFDRISILDSKSLALLATIETSHPLRSLSMSNDGSHIIGISADGPDLLVFSVETNREVKRISNVAVSPEFVVVAP